MQVFRNSVPQRSVDHIYVLCLLSCIKLRANFAKYHYRLHIFRRFERAGLGCVNKKMSLKLPAETNNCT